MARVGRHICRQHSVRSEDVHEHRCRSECIGTSLVDPGVPSWLQVLCRVWVHWCNWLGCTLCTNDRPRKASQQRISICEILCSFYSNNNNNNKLPLLKSRHTLNQHLSCRTAFLSLSCHAGQKREVRLGPCVTRDHTVFNLPPTHGPQFVCSPVARQPPFDRYQVILLGDRVLDFRYFALFRCHTINGDWGWKSRPIFHFLRLVSIKFRGDGQDVWANCSC